MTIIKTIARVVNMKIMSAVALTSVMLTGCVGEREVQLGEFVIDHFTNEFDGCYVHHTDGTKKKIEGVTYDQCAKILPYSGLPVRVTRIGEVTSVTMNVGGTELRCSYNLSVSRKLNCN